MNKIYLTRSLPGAGKSFLVNQMTKDLALDEFAICCADDYLLLNGEYKWSPERCGAAHMKCYRKFLESLIQKIPNVFVTNTGLVFRDCKEYIRFGALADYEIHLIQPKTWWRDSVEVCYIMNSHGLTYEKLEMMKKRMQTDEEICRFAAENLGVKIHHENQ